MEQGYWLGTRKNYSRPTLSNSTNYAYPSIDRPQTYILGENKLLISHSDIKLIFFLVVIASIQILKFFFFLLLITIKIKNTEKVN